MSMQSINPVEGDLISWIPQAQLGIVLLECPWDPLKKEGVEGHRERGWEREREREREKIPTTVQGGSTPHRKHAISQSVMAR